MTIATDAVAFYGIAFDEEDHLWPWEDSDSEDFDDDEEAAGDPESRWMKRKKIVGITCGRHCTDSVPMGYVAIDETLVIAKRGYPESLNGLRQHAGAAVRHWDAGLRKFCKAAGYDFDQLMTDGKVGWRLVSYWET